MHSNNTIVKLEGIEDKEIQSGKSLIITTPLSKTVYPLIRGAS